jgi:N-acetylglutamate synthase-like GNAT family acetyltransferase
MTFNIRLAEVSEAKQIIALSEMFLNEYEQSNAKIKRLPFKQQLNAIRNDIKDKRLYVVTSNNSIIAFTDLIEIGDSKMSYFFIRNLYVKQEYRNQSVAKMLRDTLIARNRIVGTTVTYKRLREKIDYFKQSFNYVYHDVAHEQNATDDNLVYLSTKDIWGCAFQIDFHSINKMQQTAQEVLNAYVEMLRQRGYNVTTE